MSVLCLLICLLNTHPMAAQDCAAITGHVLDAVTGEALAGASVRAGGDRAGMLAGTDGSFVLTAHAGDTLWTTFVGYEPAAVVISACQITVLLRPVATAMDPIVVEGERLISEEFAIRKLNKLDVYTNPSAKADPLLAVNSLPFATTTDESANISLRGGSPAETGVFLNDVPIEDAVRYAQLNGLGTFSIFNTALIHEVQVYPGNPPMEFGNSTSGVISLYSDEDIPAHNATQLSATLAGVGAFHTRKISAKSSLTLFTNLQGSGLFSPVNARALRELKSFFSADVGVHYFARLSPTLSLKIFNYTLREAYRYRYAHPTWEGIFRQDRARNLTVANLRKQWHQLSVSLNQGFSVSASNYNFSSLDIVVPSRDYYTALNVHQSGRTYHWKTGLVYEYKQLATYGAYPAYPFAFGSQFGDVPVSDQRNITLMEAFGYFKRYVGESVTLGGGIRKNLPYRDVDYLSWQLNANVRPGRHWSINMSAGDYNKQVLSRESQAVSYLISSRQYSLDVNVASKKLDFANAFYYKKIARGPRLESVYGAELYARYKFNHSWRTQLSFTSLRAHDDQGIGTPYNVHYFLRGNVEYRLPGTWTMTLVFLLRQGSLHYPVDHAVLHESLGLFEPVYAQTPSRLPAYNTVDFNVSRIFNVNARTTAIGFLNVANVADFRNVRSFNYNFDYSLSREQLFSRRVIYFGVVFMI